LDQNEPPWTPHDCGWSKQLSTLQEIKKQKYDQSKLIKRADIVARRKRKLGIPTVLEKPKTARKKANKQRRRRAKAI
jgi:hypothetical protein